MVHRIAFPPLNPDRGRRIATASTAHTNRTGRSACPTTLFEPGRTDRLRRRALERSNISSARGVRPRRSPSSGGFRPSQALRQLGRHAAGRQRKHQTRNTTKKYADANQSADRPLRAPWPGSPNQEGENYANDRVKQDPAGPRQRPKPVRHNEFQDAFHPKIERKSDCQRHQTPNWIDEQISAYTKIENTQENFPKGCAAMT